VPKDTYYIKLDVNAYDDNKVKIIRKYYGNMEAFGSYIFLVLKLRQESNCQLEYSDFTFEALSIDMGKTPEQVKKFIDDCIKFKLFKKDSDSFYSERLKRDKAHLDNIREKTSIAGKISAEKRYGKPSPLSLPKEGDIARMIELYEQRIGRIMTPPELEILKDIADNYDMESFEKALDLAKGKKSPIKYIARVLENWKQEKEPKQPSKPVRRTYDDGMEGMKEE
jgi:DnaD/phage-associated family protein